MRLLCASLHPLNKCAFCLLLAGRLDITYVDEALRVGRDDKGHTFVLERAARSDAADAGIAEA